MIRTASEYSDGFPEDLTKAFSGYTTSQKELTV
jgi:hypothetical protein